MYDRQPVWLAINREPVVPIDVKNTANRSPAAILSGDEGSGDIDAPLDLWGEIIKTERLEVYDVVMKIAVMSPQNPCRKTRRGQWMEHIEPKKDRDAILV